MELSEGGNRRDKVGGGCDEFRNIKKSLILTQSQ